MSCPLHRAVLSPKSHVWEQRWRSLLSQMFWADKMFISFIASPLNCHFFVSVSRYLKCNIIVTGYHYKQTMLANSSKPSFNDFWVFFTLASFMLLFSLCFQPHVCIKGNLDYIHIRCKCFILTTTSITTGTKSSFQKKNWYFVLSPPLNLISLRVATAK